MSEPSADGGKHADYVFNRWPHRVGPGGIVLTRAMLAAVIDSAVSCVDRDGVTVLECGPAARPEEKGKGE